MATVKKQTEINRIVHEAVDRGVVCQIHEVIYADEPDRHFEPGSSIEALDAAKRSGRVRLVGFTGHKDRRFISARCRTGIRSTPVGSR